MMRGITTGLLICLLFAKCQAQQSAAEQRWSQYVERLEEMRKPGEDAFREEDLRKRAKLCVSARTEEEQAVCLRKEAGITDRNYLSYARMISLVLRTDLHGTVLSSTPQQLSFDEAEKMWQKSRFAVCEANKLGQSGEHAQARADTCSMQLTRDHMEELSHIYFLQLELIG